MKKLTFILLLLLAKSLIFSQTKQKLNNYLIDENSFWSDNTIEFYDYTNLYDNMYLVFGIYSLSNTISINYTDGIKILESFSITNLDYSKTIYKFNNLPIFVNDFDYDGKNDFLSSYIGEPNDTYLNIYSVYKDKSLLEIDFTDYSYKEYQFAWIDYCIINGKRGIRVHSRGNARYIDDYYFYDGKHDQLSFFYWSPTEQRYILDETVTQEQIKNAYCPEEYFAYNGLDFSKLDKPLKKTDLQNLTPAQLRLMRNAIYAKHGRTFNSVDLQSLWECYTWYKPNPDYTDDMLTKKDKKNIKLIQEQEKITGVYTPDLPKK